MPPWCQKKFIIIIFVKADFFFFLWIGYFSIWTYMYLCLYSCWIATDGPSCGHVACEPAKSTDKTTKGVCCRLNFPEGFADFTPMCEVVSLVEAHPNHRSTAMPLKSATRLFTRNFHNKESLLANQVKGSTFCLEATSRPIGSFLSSLVEQRDCQKIQRLLCQDINNGISWIELHRFREGIRVTPVSHIK